MKLTSEELAKLDRQVLKADFPFSATELNEWLLERGYEIKKKTANVSNNHGITPEALRAVREQVYGIYDEPEIIEVEDISDD